MSLNPISSQSLTVFIYLFIVVIVSRTRSRALVAGDGIPATGRASSSEADIFVERIQSKYEARRRDYAPVGGAGGGVAQLCTELERPHIARYPPCPSKVIPAARGGGLTPPAAERCC